MMVVSASEGKPGPETERVNSYSAVYGSSGPINDG
jgi:hypothetical protein